MHTHTHVPMIYVYICVYICVYIYVHVCMHVCMHDMYTYIYTYTFMCIYRDVSGIYFSNHPKGEHKTYISVHQYDEYLSWYHE